MSDYGRVINEDKISIELAHVLARNRVLVSIFNFNKKAWNMTNKTIETKLENILVFLEDTLSYIYMG